MQSLNLLDSLLHQKPHPNAPEGQNGSNGLCCPRRAPSLHGERNGVPYVGHAKSRDPKRAGRGDGVVSLPWRNASSHGPDTGLAYLVQYDSSAVCSTIDNICSSSVRRPSIRMLLAEKLPRKVHDSCHLVRAATPALTPHRGKRLNEVIWDTLDG